MGKSSVAILQDFWRHGLFSYSHACEIVLYMYIYTSGIYPSNFDVLKKLNPLIEFLNSIFFKFYFKA